MRCNGGEASGRGVSPMTFSWLSRREGAKSLEAALNDNDPKEIRKAAVNYLRRHRHWYAFWSFVLTWTWNLLTLAIIILGGLTSILTAYQIENRALLTILPAVSALLGTILIQFRMRDVWR